VETVTITLNGRQFAGPPGTTILELAKQVGVQIPTLCHHPLLRTAGACRVCLVEDVKTGRLVASCVTPIAAGMEIQTESPAAFKARRGVLELILSDHPSACVVCSKGNQCVLRSLAKDHGICDPELEPLRRWRPMEEVNPFIVRDLTKCVLCGRCIRVCQDFEAVGAVDHMDRGYASHPGTASRTPLEGSECNFCGSCVSLCPTDALAERDRAAITSGKERAHGICSYCGTGCHLEYELSDKIVVAARGVPGSPVNSLSLCVRGHYGQDALRSHERLRKPLVRNEDGTYRQASWTEAIADAAGRLKQIIKHYGPSSVGVVVGTQCSNEEMYLAARFARATVGTPNIDSTTRFTSAAIVDGLAAHFRGMRPGVSLDLLEQVDTIVLIAARPEYTHPVVARNIRRAVRGSGAALIQLDLLRTSLTPFSRIHVRETIGQQPRVLVQMMREVVAKGLHDEAFVRANAVEAEDFLAALKPQPGQQAAAAEIKQAAGLLGAERRCVFLIGSGAARAMHGYILTRLVADLALLCGQPGNILTLMGGCNELGVWEMGCVPDRLPGCSLGDGPDALETLESVWGAKVAAKRGLDAMGMMHAVEKGDLKALFLLGVDPLAIYPDTARTRKALIATDLVVRTGLFPAVTEELAHFVLPAAALTEMDGSYTSIEGRVQRVAKLSEPPGNARPTARIILDLAGKLGPAMGFITARDVFDEIRAVCGAWDPLTWADVGRPGGTHLDWASPEAFAKTLADKQGQLVPYAPPENLPPRVKAPKERPWRLVPEEQTAHPGDGVLSRGSSRLSRFNSDAPVRMNPEDAARISAGDGSWVILQSEVGEVRAKLAVDAEVPSSLVVIPAGGPGYIFQRLLPWPEEYVPSGWDRIFVAVSRAEE
jgi:formate dehydrogenase alpha subunit